MGMPGYSAASGTRWGGTKMIICGGYEPVEETTWGKIKATYK